MVAHIITECYCQSPITLPMVILGRVLSDQETGLSHSSYLVMGKRLCILFLHHCVSKPYRDATVHFCFLDFSRHELDRCPPYLPNYKINVSNTLIFKCCFLELMQRLSTSTNSPSVEGDTCHSTEISKEFLLLKSISNIIIYRYIIINILFIL